MTQIKMTLSWISLIGSVLCQPAFQVISALPDALPLVSPPRQNTQSPVISFDPLEGDSIVRAVNGVDQIGDTFHALYESVLYGQLQHVSFKIKSPEGVVYLYNLLCERTGHCDVRIQSRTKNRKGNPNEALALFLKGNGEVQFTQPPLKLGNTSFDILETLKGTNDKLKLVDELWSKTHKMKNISDKKKAEFALEVLRAHNTLREHHGTDTLALEKKLMEDAQSYADKCARSGSIVPRTQMSPYGENIWGLSTNASDADDIQGGRSVEKWYSEIRHYTFGQEPENNVAGHLTQLLWGNTKYLGVGIAANDNGQIFVICEYYPPGNYLGEYAANVKPLQKPFTTKEAEEISIPSLSQLTISNSSSPMSPSSNTARNKTVEEIAQIRLSTLQFHNEKRKLHALKSLGYSEELESLAQTWAEHLLANGTFYHRPDNMYGENIYFYTSSFHLDDKETIRKAVEAWYDEIDFYRSFDREPTVEELSIGNATGHFTQVVWNTTTHVGLGIARKDSANSHQVVLVANYAPAGNIIGKFKENVPRPVARTEGIDKKTKVKPPAEKFERIKQSNGGTKHVQGSNINTKHGQVFKQNVTSGASLEKLSLSNVTRNISSAAKELTKSVNASSTSQIAKPKTSGNLKTPKASEDSMAKSTSSKDLERKIGKRNSEENSLDKKLAMIDPANNASKVDGSLLSTITSENVSVISSGSRIVRREVRGLRLFSGPLADLRTPSCPEK